MTRAPEPSQEELREIMGHYATGAVIVTASLDGVPHGLAVNSLTSVSLEPPLILFCPATSSDTWPAIERAGHFAVNVLAAGQDHLCRLFAKKDADRFAHISYTQCANGSPVFDGIVAHMGCRIEQIYEAGDHFVAIGRVLEVDVKSAQLPLIFHGGGFHTLAALDDRLEQQGCSAPDRGAGD